MRRVVELQMWVIDLLRKLKGGADEAGAACDSVFAAVANRSTRNTWQKAFQTALARSWFAEHSTVRPAPHIGHLALTVGVSPKVVSEQLGHTSVAFTLDVYSHVLPHMQDDAAAKMEAALMGVTKRSQLTGKR